MEYANHLKEYASAMSEAQVAEEVDRIRKAAVRNHTPEVYKLCYSAVDLTTLSCTDSVESVTEFAGKAVKFYQQFPHLIRFFEEFAKSGTLPPWIAVWIPNVLYLCIAVYLYRKAPK